MRITFLGAVRTVTGSMHLVETGESRLLLDCGLFQGHREEAARINGTLPFDASSLEAAVLSHAHLDHCGNLPNLVRQGFRGPIYCTPATRDLLAIMLADSARIQRQEAVVSRIVGRAEEESTGDLYSGAEVNETLELCAAISYETWADIGAGVRARFLDAGHLLGSAMIELRCETAGASRSITYTGDLGRASLNFLRAPAPLPP